MPEVAGVAHLGRQMAARGMNILFLSAWFPFPPTNGSELRINALLRGLAARHEVTLLSFQRRPASETVLAEANAVLHGVQLVPWQEFEPSSVRSIAGYLSTQPRSVVGTYSPDMAQLIRHHVASGDYDLIVCSQLAMAAYAGEFGAVPAVLEEIELGVFAQQADYNGPTFGRLRKNLMWTKLQAHVRRLLPRFAACTVVSAEEREILRYIAPDYRAVEIIPNCIHVSDYENIATERRENSLIFTGSFTYRANFQAMMWFMTKVYPIVREQVPSLRVTVTGESNGLTLPHSDAVTCTGFVDDIKPLVAGSSISIVPILQGGGTRLKILEAMALGTPVVTTSKGAEGLNIVDGEHLVLADTPDDFAEAITLLLSDTTLRNRVIRNGCQLVRKEYNWPVVMPRFLRVVEHAGTYTD